MDLIDQLYKDARLKIADGYSAQIINENPLLAFKPFKGFTFVLMGAFNSPEDIHPLTLRQIGKLVD